jgi:hypothetical protein
VDRVSFDVLEGENSLPRIALVPLVTMIFGRRLLRWRPGYRTERA